MLLAQWVSGNVGKPCEAYIDAVYDLYERRPHDSFDLLKAVVTRDPQRLQGDFACYQLVTSQALHFSALLEPVRAIDMSRDALDSCQVARIICTAAVGNLRFLKDWKSTESVTHLLGLVDLDPEENVLLEVELRFLLASPLTSKGACQPLERIRLRIAQMLEAAQEGTYSEEHARRLMSLHDNIVSKACQCVDEGRHMGTRHMETGLRFSVSGDGYPSSPALLPE